MKKNLLNRKINIQGVWYSISTHDFNSDKPNEDDHQWGGCSYNDKTILIDTSLSEQMIRPILAHEVAHGVMQEYNVDAFIRNVLKEAVEAVKKGEEVDIDEMALRIEEEVCDSMETGHKAFKNI